jgi:2-iminobutanoate/2-iminopropanoate deaminase
MWTGRGLTLERVAAVTVCLRNADDFAAMNEVYARCFPANPPTCTTIVAGPVEPAALVEISLVALPAGAGKPRHPAGRLDKAVEPIQLRHPLGRHALALGAAVAERARQLGGARRHEGADRPGAAERRRHPESRRHDDG